MENILNTDCYNFKLVSQPVSFDLQEQYANVTAIRTGVPYDPASLAEPVVYNIGVFVSNMNFSVN